MTGDRALQKMWQFLAILGYFLMIENPVCNRRDTIQHQGRLQTRKLGQFKNFKSDIIIFNIESQIFPPSTDQSEYKSGLG